MAALLRKRKGKVVASSSGKPPKFKTSYHEAHYKKFFIARDILTESRIEYEEESLNPMKVQIITRKWEKLARPIQGGGFNMIREFYANAWRLEEEKDQPKTYKTMVRGVDISFALDAIHKVLKTRERPLPNVASYHDRKNENLRLDEVQEYLCEEEGKWVHHANGRPHYLKRNDLTDMGRGWSPETRLFPKNRALMQRPWPELENQDSQDSKGQQPHNNHHSNNHNPKSSNNKSSLQTSTLILTPLCHRFIGGLINNTRIDRMDDQLSFLCYSNQMVNETMYYPYQNTARQFREMEAQGIPVTIANLAIHRHREEEMNQERMRNNQTVQEAAAERAREENKGKAREVVPDSDEDMDELTSEESEEW
ncbi:hypothetical protein PIB30_046573 [Stylosanthes scabra]|uniref:Putative plant transposon protein domain-containing protein n=1 Tax=Stylosanthes scabra TaxID=79078 RepID=A0ABU6XHT9_9FABA|nr:hypothetical protein [Stylosanthes scabra]